MGPKKQLKMTIDDCKIVFDDNPYKVFYPGQKIAGHIELTAASSTKVKGAYKWNFLMNFVGLSK